MELSGCDHGACDGPWRLFRHEQQRYEDFDFELVGNYPLTGVKNVEIDHARMISKDAFWNSENVTVRNAFISGEYLGWNAKNLTLIDCTIESLQGMCYIDNLVMKNCKLEHDAGLRSTHGGRADQQIGWIAG